MREEQTKGERVKKRGAYKVSHIRIIEEPPKIDYDEMKRLQTKYKLTELAYQIDRLNKQKRALEKKYDELRTAESI